MPVDLAQVTADLKTLSNARVYFAHQSVGRNILKGIEMLSQETGVSLRVEEVAENAAAPEGPGLFHTNVGQNGAANSKISSFVSAVKVPSPASYDVAILKLCYTDLGSGSQDQSPKDLFDRYQRSISAVEVDSPGVTILHSTIPLRAEPPGMKTKVKRMLGMSIISDADNQLRSEYNSLVRAQGTTALFDVARLEATRRDGSLATFTVSGHEVEMLAPEHTYDGGHLNDPAKRHFAAEFLHALANAVRARQAAVAS